MNRIVLGIAALVGVVWLVVSCKKKEDPEPENQAPTVTIVKPIDGIAYGIDNADTTFAIEVNATDSDGSVTKVELFVEGVKIAEDNSAPYSHNYTFIPDKVYTIKATATDNEGAVTSKEFSNVIVIPN